MALLISNGTPCSVRNLPMFSLSTSTAFHLPGRVSLIVTVASWAAICARNAAKSPEARARVHALAGDASRAGQGARLRTLYVGMCS